MRFRSLQFDSLRSSTTFVIQIYARKTHAGNASVHKPYLNYKRFFESVEVSKNQVWAYNAILNMSGNGIVAD